MKTITLPLVIACTLLGACSNPTAYQVNPKPDQHAENQEGPASQQEGYMRIIGDLRWDHLKTIKGVVASFPKCPTIKIFDQPGDKGVFFADISSASEKVIDSSCGLFVVGGVKFYFGGISYDKADFPDEGFIFIPDPVQMRLFLQAIIAKYGYEAREWTGNYNFRGTDVISCSKYTCFKLAVSKSEGNKMTTKNNYFEYFTTDKTRSIFLGTPLDSRDF